MSNELIVYVVPSECLSVDHLYDVDPKTDEPYRIRDRYTMDEFFRLKRNRAELLRRHPGAFYPLSVPATSVWHPPKEPAYIHARAAVQQRHERAVAKSLVLFLNRHLARLDGMARTGAWVLGRGRVVVSDLRGTSPDPRSDDARSSRRRFRWPFARKITSDPRLTTSDRKKSR